MAIERRLPKLLAATCALAACGTHGPAGIALARAGNSTQGPAIQLLESHDKLAPGWQLLLPGPTALLPRIAVHAERLASLKPKLTRPKLTRTELDRIQSSSAKSRVRSQEWRRLPRQPWETDPYALPSNTDSLGFDKDIKIAFSRPKGFELEAVATTDRLRTLGKISSARSGAEYLSLGDMVYISAEEDLQIGDTYSLTREPDTLGADASDRKGYAYPILGNVRITSVNDRLYSGIITSGHDLISRGAEIITKPARVPELEPEAAASPVEGVVLLDRRFSSYMTAQHKLIFVDKGSSDGVKVGNVFRAFEHRDLSNDSEITKSDFIVNADALVVHVSESFCTAMVIRSDLPIGENNAVVLLTDVSSLKRGRGAVGIDSSPRKKGGDELDELDKLDSGDGLGNEEKRELKQLERWKSNPSPTPTPDTSATPAAGDTPPPAPSSEVAPAPTTESTPKPTATSSEEVPPPPPPDLQPPAEAPKDTSQESRDLENLMGQ